MLVDYVGLFMTGFLSGQFVGALVMTALHLTVKPDTVWVTIGVQFLTGVLMAQVREFFSSKKN